jgi:hypothetical protein
MTENCPDAFVRAVRPWCARVCPPAIQERVVDQALADLADDRAAAPPGLSRHLVTVAGAARLVAAMMLSLVVLRRQWRQARWWPEPVVGRDAYGWLTLLTLLVVVRVAAMRPPAARTWVLLPDFLLVNAVPLALPAAAAAVALTLRTRRVASAALLAAGAALLSIALTTGAPAVLAAVTPGQPAARAAAQGAAAGAASPSVVRAAAWQRFQQLRREAWRHYGRHQRAALAVYCLLLPTVAVLVATRLRLRFGTVAALGVSAASVELLFRWSTRTPPAITPLSEAAAMVWLPHAVLVVGIVALWMSPPRNEVAGSSQP